MKVYCLSCEDEHQVPFRPTADDLNCPACCTRMVSSLNRERTPIERKAKPKQQRPISEASPEQRAKIDAFPFCLACGRPRSRFVAIDPAHLCQRSLGGCDDAACVVPLCRTFGDGGCHRLYDDGKLDLLRKIADRWPTELVEAQHMLVHLSPVEMLEQLAGARTQWSDAVAVSV